MNSMCRNRGEKMYSAPPRNRNKCFRVWLGWEKRKQQVFWWQFIKFRLDPPAMGSPDIKDYWAGKWHDNTWQVSKSKNDILQVRPRCDLRGRVPGSQKGYGCKHFLSRSSLMSDCRVTTLAPHHVCSSDPHTAPEILPQMALVNLDTAETSSNGAHGWLWYSNSFPRS